MARGLFDPSAIARGWWDETAKPEGWFNRDLLDEATAAPSDPVLLGRAALVTAAIIASTWLAPQFELVRVPVVIDSVETVVQEQVFPRPDTKVIRDSWTNSQYQPVKRAVPVAAFVTVAAPDDPVHLRDPNPAIGMGWLPKTPYAVKTLVVIEDGIYVAADDPVFPRAPNPAIWKEWLPKVPFAIKTNVAIEDNTTPPATPDDPVALRNHIQQIQKWNPSPSFTTYYTNVYIHVEAGPFKRYDFSRKIQEWSVQWEPPRRVVKAPWIEAAVVTPDEPPLTRKPNPNIAASWATPAYYPVVRYPTAALEYVPPGGFCIPVQILNGVSKANIHGVSISGISLTPCGGGTYVVTEFNTVSDNRSDDTSYEGYEY